MNSDQSEESHKNNRFIDLFLTPAEIDEERAKGYAIIVVVDVLRAATTITIALSNGARNVIPVNSISTATTLAAQLSRDDVLLCGEREGKLIDGFHVGNSPADYSRDRVRGKILIFATTNGTPSLVKVSQAGTVYLCGFINHIAILKAILKHNNPFPFAVLCAGKFNKFALEDVVCGGLLIQKVCEQRDYEFQFNDGARAAIQLAKSFDGDYLKLLTECDHGRYLSSIGMAGDLPVCASYSVQSIVPRIVEGKLVKEE